MTYEIELDENECVSSGKCIAGAGGYFVFDADEIATIDRAVDQPDDDTILRIARQCPSGAIKLRRNGEDVEL